MKKKDADFIFAKLEEWTRCEIMARLGRFDNLEYADYFVRKIDIENEIRRFLYGSDSLVILGHKFGIIKDKPKSKRKMKKKTKKNFRKRQSLR